MAYDAGTAFLQIVPSFRGIDDKLKAGVRDIAQSISGGLADALPEGIAQGEAKARAQAKTTGRKTGEDYGGALIAALKAKAEKAAGQIGSVKIKTDVDPDKNIEKSLLSIAKRLAKFSNKKVGLNFDVDGEITKLLKLRDQLEGLQSKAKDAGLAFNAGAAAGQLGGIDDLVRQMSERGFTAGGAFNKGFNNAAKQAQDSLADQLVPVDAAKGDLRRLVSYVREQLGHQSDLNIPVGLDEERALNEMRTMLAHLDEIAASDDASVQLKVDSATAAKALRGFLDDIEAQAKDHGDDAGRQYMGAYTEAIRRDAAKAAAAAGEIDPTLNLDLDSSAAHLKLAAIGEEIRSISEHVGIDIDTATAQARLAELLAEVRLIGDAAGDNRELTFNAKLTGDLLEQITALGVEAEKVMDNAGGDAGDRFTGAFLNQLRKISAEAQAQLGEIDVVVGADTSSAQLKAAYLKRELEDLSSQIDLGMDASLVLARLKEIRQEIADVRREAGDDIELHFNTSEAEKALAAADELERKARGEAEAQAAADGGRNGGAYAEAYKAALKAAAANLPEFDIDADSSKLEKRIAKIRAVMQSLGELNIGIDIDDAAARAEIEKLRAGLKRTLADETIDINVRTDTTAALRELDKYLETAGTQSAAAGARNGGAYAQAYKAAMQAAAANLPEFDIDADSSKLEKRIAKIREVMKSLGDVNIGIDIDDAKARAELEKLRAGLKRTLADETIDVNVRADTESALRELDKFLDTAGTQADKLGLKVRETLSAALSNLPQADITADTTQAEARLERIRAALAEVRDLHISGDLDDAAAITKIEALKARLMDLAAKSPDITVSINAARALAELEAIKLGADEVAGSVGNIGESAAGSGSRLAALIAAIGTLVSVAVPAGAAAAAAIGSIGTAAGAAVAGIGVTALGLFGIGDAVTALNKAGEDSAKTAKSLGSSNDKLANSADQVQTAEQNLANARASNADAAINAAQRVEDAEYGLTQARKDAADSNIAASRALATAQDNERDSREKLNKAIQDAKDDMAELDIQVAKNSLNQREATTAAAVAKQKLDVILANPRASQIEKDQAQAAYDEQVLQFKDLQVKRKALDRQQADYAKNGVEASDKVKSARKSEQDAVVKVGDAEQKVTDTRAAGAHKISAAQNALAAAQRQQDAQQRQAAQNIRTAQQQIVTATRAAQQAITASASAGGSALDNLNTAMAKLTPTGQEFAKYIYGLKPKFQELTGIAQEGLLPGLQQGIETLMGNLGGFEDFVGRVSKAMGGIFSNFAAVLQQPIWQRFFGYFDKTAVPTLDNLYKISINLAGAFAGIFLALTPFNDGIMKGLVDYTTRFAQWAETLTRSSGYIKFFSYVQENGPKVAAFIGSIATFAERFVQAAAPIGTVVLAALQGIVDALNSIPIGNLQLFLIAIAAVGAAGLVIGGVSASLKVLSGVFGPVITYLKNFVTLLKTQYAEAAVIATTATDDLTAAQVRTKASASVAKTAFGNLLGALTGVTAAITIAVLIGGELISEHMEHKKKVEDLASAYAQLGEAYSETHDLSSQAVVDAISANKQLGDLVIQASQLGISLEQLVASGQGDPTAYDAVNQAIDERIAKLKEQAEAQKETAGQSVKDILFGPGPHDPRDSKHKEALNNAIDTGKQISDLEDQKTALKDSADQAQRVAEIQKALTAARSGDAAVLAAQQTPMTVKQNQALDANQAAIQKATDKLNLMIKAQGGDASAKAQLFKTALDEQKVSANQTAGALGRVAKGVTLTQVAYNGIISSQEDFASGLLNLKSTVDASKKSHDKNATSIAFNSKNLEKNSATAIANRQALSDLIQKSKDAFISDVQNGVGVDDARKAHQKRIEALKIEAKNLGLNKGAVDKYVKAQGTINDKILTQYESKNFTAAYNDLARLNFMQQEIKAGKSAATALQDYKRYQAGLAAQDSVAKTQANQAANRAANKPYATGGRIFGPGTKTSDSVPILASAGEYMHQASAVDYYGTSVMDAMNHRLIPRDLFKYAKGGIIAGFAKGGAITNSGRSQASSANAPIIVDFSAMDIAKPTVAEAKAIVGGDAPAPSGGTAVGSEKLAEIAERTARALGATTKQLVALMEAGIVESGLHNLPYGDRDSVGFLQQRPSQGWGTVAQIMDPAYATTKFIQAAKRADRKGYNAGELAQAVQRSGFPLRYGQHEADAYAVLNRNAPYVTGGGGGGGAGGLGSAGNTAGSPGYQWEIGVLRKAFGNKAIQVTSTTGGGHATNSWHYKGRAIDFIPTERKYGEWIMANYGANTKELIGPYDGMRIKDGRLHDYSAATEAQHKNHWHWAYDSGGWLQPGITSVVNATKKPEAVFTASQFQDIRSLVEVSRAGMTTGGGNSYQFDFGNSTLTHDRLNSLQQRSNSLARINRSNY